MEVFSEVKIPEVAFDGLLTFYDTYITNDTSL